MVDVASHVTTPEKGSTAHALEGSPVESAKHAHGPAMTIPQGSPNGQYFIYDKFNSTFSVWCDSTSEKGITWTLIESFALSQNDRFKKSPFYNNLEINENIFSWEAYRLSHAHTEEIAHRSTHFRPTCNFPALFSYVDYLRAKLSDIDLLNQGARKDGRENEPLHLRNVRCAEPPEDS